MYKLILSIAFLFVAYSTDAQFCDATITYFVSEACPDEIDSYASLGNNPTGSTYTWSTTGGTIVAGQGTPNVQIAWNGYQGNATISLTVSQGFNCYDTKSIIQYVGYPTPFSITGDFVPSIPCNSDSEVVYVYDMYGGCNGPAGVEIDSFEVTGNATLVNWVHVVGACWNSDTVTVKITGPGPISLNYKARRILSLSSPCPHWDGNLISPQFTNPVANFSHSTSGSTVTFQNLTSGMDSVRYFFGDGTSSNLPNPVHTYSPPGSYQACQVVYSGPCLSDTFCQTVNPTNCLTALFNSSSITNQLAIDFTDQSTFTGPITSWQWSFGDGNSSALQNPQHLYSTPGTYNVCLTVSNTCDTVTTCSNVTVNCTAPSAGFINTTLSNGVIQFNDTSMSASPIQSWFWEFGDGGISNQQNPSHTYQNFGTYNVCLYIQDSCSIDTFCQTVTVACVPPIAGFNHSTSILTANFYDQSIYTGTGSTWSWDFGDGNTSTQASPQHTYTAAGTYNVCQIVDNGCTTDSICQSITVSCQPPNLTTNLSNFVLYMSYGANSPNTNSATSWYWDLGDGTTSNTQYGTHIYSSPGTYNVCVIVDNGCGIDTACQLITVTCSNPTAGFNTSVNLSSVNFYSIGPNFGNSNSYFWDFGDGSTSNQYNPVHTYGTAGTFTVCMWIDNGCGIDSICQQVTTTCQQPSAAFTTNTNNNNNVFFSNQSSNTNSATIYNWDFGDGGTSQNSSVVHAYAASGAYNVCLTADNGCGIDTACQTINVNCPTPTAGFSSVSNFYTVDFTNQSSSFSFYTTYLWEFGDGDTSHARDPQHIYTTTGNYNVCLYVTNPCGVDTFCQQVFAGCPTANAAFTSSSNAMVASFTNQTPNPPNSNFLWDFGDGTTSVVQNPQHIYSSIGTYTVCLIATNNCGADTSCQQVTIGNCLSPTAAFGFSGNLLSFNFTDQSVNGPPVQSWEWNFGDGSTSTLQNPAHQYASVGTYTVCLIATNVCGSDTICQQVSATCPSPTSAFSSTTNLLTANFTNQSSGNPTITSQQWDFGDGSTSTSTNPQHAYSLPGTYTACLITTNTCGSDTTCQQVTVTCPPPVAAFSSTSNLLTTTFTDMSSSNTTSWQWDFGDGNSSTLQFPQHTYAAAGTYTICLIATNTCGSDTICQQVTVTCPPPTSAFSSTSNLLTVNFTNLSSGTPSIISQQWDFGDGSTSTSTNPQHAYSLPGTYTVCLITTNTCGSDTSCQQVTVTCPPPTAAFSSTSNLLTTTFTDMSSSNTTSWQWDFGDGNSSTLQNPQHNYATPGTYTVCLIATNQCSSDTVCQPQVVSSPPPPVANFGYSSNLLTVTFADQSSSANTLQSWLWQFGDGNMSTQQNPTHTYSTTGVYGVTLIANDQFGSDTVTNQVTVNCPAPSAGFGWSGSFPTLQFTNQSTSNFANWSWDFGDGQTSSDANPIHTYTTAGNYTVCLIVDDTCGADTTCQSLTLVGRAPDHKIAVTISPNPTSGIFKIEPDPKMIMEDLDFRLLDYTGRHIPRKEFQTHESPPYLVSMHDLAPGIYFLEVDYQGQKQIFRIVKQ